jgi:Zn-dependent protease
LLGLVHPLRAVQPTWVSFCGTMAYLNFIATLFNLIPVPPLDGYRLIEHRLSYEMQWKLRQPQVAMATFALLFGVFAVFPWVWIPLILMFDIVTSMLGLPADLILDGYNSIF